MGVPTSRQGGRGSACRGYGMVLSCLSWAYSREFIELVDELLEDPMRANLSGVDTDAQKFEDSSQKEDEENDEDTLIAM